MDKNRDYILTRILRLRGMEKGINRGKNKDSYKRCIYIHGTAEESKIGKPSSKGCIRMRNLDVVDLFKDVSNGDYVFIRNKS